MEGAGIGQHQQISRSLGGTVGAGGVDGGLFREEQIRPIQGQIAVHLVGRHLMIPLNAVLPAGVHQGLGTQNVGAQEQPGIFHGTIHMALRCKVHDNVGMLFLKELFHGSLIRNVRLHEAEMVILHGLIQGGHVACIGQAVQADDPILWMVLQLEVDEVAANEAGTAGDDNGHACSSL